MILSPTGTLYTISSEVPAADSESKASKHLVVTARRGDEIRREIVPASTESGSHTNGLLGYDPESGTMFVFWVQHFGFLYNQLLFCARDSDGTWSEATAFGSPYNYRENLRVAVTRKVTDDNGEQTAALSIHATWWELSTSTGTASAQYWMLSDRKRPGRRCDRSRSARVRRSVRRAGTRPEDVDPNVFKHPQIVSSPQQDSVSLVFGDPRDQKLPPRSFHADAWCRGPRAASAFRSERATVDSALRRFKVGADARLDARVRQRQPRRVLHGRRQAPRIRDPERRQVERSADHRPRRAGLERAPRSERSSGCSPTSRSSTAKQPRKSRRAMRRLSSFAANARVRSAASSASPR